MAATPGALPSEVLNNTIGALEAGGMIACLLMGIVTIQVYYYFSRYPNDHLVFKAMVAFIWICEIGHSICISHAIYVTTVTSWSNPRVLIAPPKSLSTAIMFSAVSTPLIQGFLAYRIKGVAKIWTITAICWTMSLARMIFAIVSFAGGIQMVSLEQYLHDWEWSILATIVIGAATDVVIALSLIWVLVIRRQSLVTKSTVAIVDTLILWTLQTGLVTSMAGVLMLILFLAMKDNYIWLAVFTFLAKLYTNSFLAVLNGRESLRERRTRIVEIYPTSDYSGNTTLNERLRNVNSPHIISDIEFAGKSTSDSSMPGKLEHPEAQIHITREIITSH